MSDERLSELLERWEEGCLAGEPVLASDLCRDCPELMEELEEKIDKLRATSWLDEPPDDMTATWNGSGTRRIAAGPPPPPMLGRYRLDSQIGIGGFGEVWRGFDVLLARVVAIKVARLDRLGHSEAADKFLNEARRVAKLKAHAGIVPIHDFGRDGDFCYIVSDFVEGGDLAHRLDLHGPFESESAARLMVAAGDALQHAHEHDFVHLDIKPANILLDAAEKPFITDFGIASSREELANGSASSGGTLYYMSPEQLLPTGKRLDQRTDVYSLGVVLAEAVSGRRLFEGSSPDAVRAKILRGAPALTGADGLPLPAELEAIIRRCLEKDPAKRFATARDLTTALRNFLGEAPPPTPWWRTALIVVGVSLLLVLAVLGIERAQSYLAAESIRQTWGSPQSQRVVAEIALRNFGTVKIEGMQEAIFELSELPQGPFAITDVTLRDTKVTDELLFYFAEVPSIQRLNLALTPITDDGLRHLANYRQLRELRLNGTELTDAGLQHLLNMQSLQVLEIDDTAVTDEGMQVLAGIPSLCRVTIVNTRVSDAGMEHLAKLPKLRQLWVGGTAVTADGIAMIRTARPVCEVKQ